MTITYRYHEFDVLVFLDGKHVGTIKRGGNLSWRYFPKGSKVGGEPNHSLEAVKRSLETK